MNKPVGYFKEGGKTKPITKRKFGSSKMSKSSSSLTGKKYKINPKARYYEEMWLVKSPSDKKWRLFNKQERESEENYSRMLDWLVKSPSDKKWRLLNMNKKERKLQEDIRPKIVKDNSNWILSEVTQPELGNISLSFKTKTKAENFIDRNLNDMKKGKTSLRFSNHLLKKWGKTRAWNNKFHTPIKQTRKEI